MESNNAPKGISYNAEQQVALSAINSFVNGDGQVFILRGYAGTGKTTLMREVVCQYHKQWTITAMAPTGRAAHIFRENKVENGTLYWQIFQVSTYAKMDYDGYTQLLHELEGCYTE